MKDDNTASVIATFPQDLLPDATNTSVNESSHSWLYRMLSHGQRNLSFNAQRALLLLFILLQISFFTWHLATQRTYIENNAVRILRNTALLEAQQFETSMDAMRYQMRVIGNAILLNKTVSLEDAEPFLDQELRRDWLDGVIVFDAQGRFLAKDSVFPLAEVLDATTLAQKDFRDNSLFKELHREQVNERLLYWQGNGIDQKFAGFVMYRAVRDPQGRYLGGTVGYFKSTTMANLFLKMQKKGFDLGPGGVMSVLEHDSGFLFARMGTGTHDFKITATDSSLMSFASDTAEAHDYVSPVDGVARLGVFLSLNDRKWVLVVGLAKRDILSDWYVQSILTAFGVLGMVILQWLLLHYIHANFLQRERLAQEARFDPLTELANRRHFDEWAKAVCSLTKRNQQSLCVLAIDLDHFKQINDSYGHDGGDAVLKCVADTLRGALRGSDIVARFGGEEFVVALPYTGLDKAGEVAERIRTDLAALAVEYQGQTIRFTASVGLARMTPDELRVSKGIHATLARADQALYRAKQEGRNRVTVAVTVANQN